ncbi:hypothetical protein [Photobacterium salinisoli]|uniref:hypothetical protein n=1 Tax=Photobacterium salinisoli TaxID=1616783 RepID=UPI001F096ECB|nr:hypothetical protein [Photobacterium salinisoli]
MRKVAFVLLGCLGLTACVTNMVKPNIVANGAIKWANGVREEMNVSQTGSTLTFLTPPSMLNPGGITIFSRIDSARNGNCEHYYNEGSVKVRMQVCDTGEVTLIQDGQVVNVGSLSQAVY